MKKISIFIDPQSSKTPGQPATGPGSSGNVGVGTGGGQNVPAKRAADKSTTPAGKRTKTASNKAQKQQQQQMVQQSTLGIPNDN